METKKMLRVWDSKGYITNFEVFTLDYKQILDALEKMYSYLENEYILDPNGEITILFGYMYPQTNIVDNTKTLMLKFRSSQTEYNGDATFKKPHFESDAEYLFNRKEDLEGIIIKK